MKFSTISLSITENLSLTYWLSLYLVIFAIPLVFSGPQIVVGTVVNACLFIAAKQTSPAKLIPLAILPSLAAILHGVVLGSFSPLLLIMAPFIWIGNLILMLVYKKIPRGFLAVPLASLLKTAWLFSIAFLLVNFQVLPKIFLTSMGTLQLVTALLGGSLAFILVSLVERKA